MIFNRKPIFFLLLILASVTLLQSCFPKGKILKVFNRTSVKNPPKDSTWFVFDNRIEIQPGVVSKDEQKRLETELPTYWDDSVKAKAIQQWGLFYRIKDPQRFDSTGLQRTLLFMQSYLQSQGYYNARLMPKTDSAVFIRNSKPGTAVAGGLAGGLTGTLISKDWKGGAIGTVIGAPIGYGIGALMDRDVRPQFRITSVMQINPGKRLQLNHVSYLLSDSTRPSAADSLMQELALGSAAKAFITPGSYYSKQAIASELDRLVTLFRDSGYYKLNRDNLVAYVDTTDQLIDTLIIDPFELARRTAAAAERRREHPTADVQIVQAWQVKEVPYDSSATRRYYVGNIYYYTDSSHTPIPDSLMKKDFSVRQRRNVFMKYPAGRSPFNIKPIFQHNYLYKGRLYNEQLFYKTINTFTQMGPWQQVEWRDSIRQDTVDFHIFLESNRRYKTTFAFDITRSTGDFLASNNLFGLGGNLTFLDRNFAHSAWQMSATARTGVELNLEKGSQLLQTVQAGAGLSFGIPNLLWVKGRQKRYDVARSSLNFNANYTERTNYFRIRSLTLNAMDEIYKINAAKGSSIRYTYGPNIELYSLDTLPEIRQAFDKNPFLRTAFNTGNVFGGIGTITFIIPAKKPQNSNNLRIGLEISCLPSKIFYKYVKTEIEFVKRWQHQKSQTVGRFFTGMGYNFSNDVSTGKTLPFFKQFVAGGPSSMRAWGLRQLGLGSSQLSELATDFRDRFGDIQLEANIEHRFQLMDLGAAKFSSAVFFDVGNLWNWKRDTANPLAQFNLSRLGKDIAIAGGIGLLRLNVANFIFRVDFALKLKDPARRENNGWMDFSKFTWKNENDRNNYAFQIGIGLPF